MIETVLSWSGGKDCSLALDALRTDPDAHVVALLTSVTPAYDRVSIHGVRRELLRAQASSIGLPLFEVQLPAPCTNEEYEAAFASAIGEVRRAFPSLAQIAFGDLFLEDVRAYRERLIDPLGLASTFPLWGRDTTELAAEFIARGFVAHLACVDTTQLDGGFAGERFDEALARFPSSVDPCGERGEFHTFVSDGPIFSSPIAVRTGERLLREQRFMYCDLLPVETDRHGDRQSEQ